jgi:hypothetical protein
MNLDFQKRHSFYLFLIFFNILVGASIRRGIELKEHGDTKGAAYLQAVDFRRAQRK